MWPAVPLALAIALGAVVAPPDAVAATAIAKRIGLPKRVVTILEGEALVNDATALVILSLAAGLATSGGTTSAGEVAGSLAWSIAVAAIVGYLVGTLGVKLRTHLDDHVLDVAIAAVPLGAFLGAEALHGSGIVSVVVAGLVVGNAGMFRIPAERRQAESANWASFSHLIENGAFLYLGYRLPTILAETDAEPGGVWGPIGIGLAVILLLLAVRMAFMPLLVVTIRSRARSLRRVQERETERFRKAKAYFTEAAERDERFLSSMRSFGGRLRRREADITAEDDQGISWRDGLVVGWSGMRGVVTVMAVETVPRIDGTWGGLVLVAYVVAVGTLLLHGLTLGPLARAMGLRDEPSTALDDEVNEVLAIVSEQGLGVAATLAERKQAPPETIDAIRRMREERAAVVARAGRFRDAGMESDEARAVSLTRLFVAAELEALRRQRSLGLYSSEAIGLVLHELDRLELTARDFEAESDSSGGRRPVPVFGRKRGLAALVSDHAAETWTEAIRAVSDASGAAPAAAEAESGPDDAQPRR